MSTADMSKHDDEQLEEGIEKAERNEPRLEAEGKDEAEEALEQQREAMEDELERRQP